MSKIGDWLWWFVFAGKINCTCDRTRKDGYHDTDCASWLNARPSKRR